MQSHPRLYLTFAFVAGILLTLGFKDFYPDLERRFRRKQRVPTNITLSTELEPVANVSLGDQTNLQNGEVYEINDSQENFDVIPAGIESCIANTPLFRIKSLSNETGCEILAKAEVFEIRPNVRSRARRF